MQMSSDDLMLGTCMEPGFHIPKGSLHGFGHLLENPVMVGFQGCPGTFAKKLAAKRLENP